MSEPEITPMYMTVMIKPHRGDGIKGTVFITGFYQNKQVAEKEAQERATEEGLQDTWVIIGIHRPPDQVYSQLQLWLADHDIIGAEANSLVRMIMGELARIILEAIEGDKNG